jgi:hypothetical protein
MRSPPAATLAALALAGCGAAAHSSPPQPAGRASEPFPRAVAALKVARFGSAAALAAQRRALVRAQLARLRRTPTVAAALRAALLSGRLTRTADARMVREWRGAQALLPRLAGTRQAELGAVVGGVRDLAARHLLTPDRLAPVFLELRRNTAFWARAPLPAAHWRTTFGHDPAVFQYYPGHGLRLQPLASWGRANARAHACLAAGIRCRAAALRRVLDRLSALGVRRAGYEAWEYYFTFDGGTPPWVSGMTQATAIQALARGYRALRAARWRRAALRALGAFRRPPPTGVAVGAPGGTGYLIYSFAPDYRVLNGELQALTGLHDAGALLSSRLAERLFRRGDRAARRVVAGYDTGAWSLYSDAGDESTLPYHQLLAGFLGDLCSRTREPVYCRTAARFVRYEREPPRIGFTALSGLEAQHTVPLRFSLSKVSTVSVRLWGAHGVSLARDLTLPHGVHVLDWTPPARGRFRLRIAARGPSGPLGVARRTLRVLLPKPPGRHRRPVWIGRRTAGGSAPAARLVPLRKP